MPAPPRVVRRPALWLSFLASFLLHLTGFWLAERWDQAREDKVIQIRLARQLELSPRRLIRPRRLGTAQPEKQLRTEMEYLASEAQPGERLESQEGMLRPSFPGLRLPRAPAALREEVLGGKSEAPLLAQERMVSPADLGLADSVAVAAAMDLLRIEDMARANREHAVVMRDLASRRDITGYINFTRLRLYGAGSDTGGALDALARFLRDHTRILAQVREKAYNYFLSEHLLQDPVHFIIQGGGLPVYSDHQLTDFSEQEYALLERYLRAGGFLFIEGEHRFLQEMIGHLQSILGPEGGLFEIPPSHPLYHSFYDFDGGFPGEDKSAGMEGGEPSWYYPQSNPRELAILQSLETANPQFQPGGQESRPAYLGLWGVELNGDLVAVLSDLQLHARWRGGTGFDEEDFEEDSLPALLAATNILIHALSRPAGMTPKRERPAWVRIRPKNPVQTAGQDIAGAGDDEGELFADLDASLALVQSPLGSVIERSDLQVRLDGRYSLSLLKRGLHGLLLHNMPAGEHWIELSYGGKSKQLEIDLQGGEVLTVTFTLNRLAFFSQLRLHQQDELVGLEEWRQSFEDLRIEEVYLGEDRAVLEPAAAF